MTAPPVAVPGALDGERLDRIVALLAGCTRSEASALVAGGAVRVDGTVATKGAVRVAQGALVAVDRGPAAVEASLAGDASVEFGVVFEDDDVIVVDKPAGLVVHPGAANATGTLVHGLIARYPELAHVGAPDRPGIVHRLDKETSGLLVVARTSSAYASLVAQMKVRTVARRYLALVWGRFDAPRGVIDAPIGRSARTPTRMTVSARGREARTSYDVVREYDEPAPASLVWCMLDTGRTHQIRVHLAAIGHPVVGDARYGGQREPLARGSRFFLHAARLEFDHPVTGKRLAFESPLPNDLELVLDRFSVSGAAARSARPSPSRPRPTA